MDTPPEVEQLAPPGTWVLRGGDLSPTSTDKNIRDVHEAYGIWGLCVTADPGGTLEQCSQKAHFGNKMMLRALSEELAELGFIVVREPGHDWPSALLTFPAGEPDSEQRDQLRSHMMQRGETPNPRYKGR